MNEQGNRTGRNVADPENLADEAAAVTSRRTVSERETVAYDRVPPRATVSERETVAYHSVPPRGTVVDPYPPPPPGVIDRYGRPFWVGGPGPGMIVAIVVAVIAIVVVIALLLTRGNQTTPVTAPAPIATSADVQNSAAQAPPPPAPQAAAPQPAAPVNPPPAPAVQPAAAAPPPAAAPATAVIVTAPPVAIAPAPSSAPISAADTTPSTVLDVGGTWRQNGLELTMGPPRISAGSLIASFSLKNIGATEVRFQFTRSGVFSATDNRNNRLTVNDPNYRYDFTLQPNATMNLDSSAIGGPITFSGALSAPQVSSVAVMVNGLNGITNAQWRIAVQH